MIPDWLKDKLANPPAAGNGVHAWLYSVSRQLHAHWPASQIAEALEAATRNVERHVSRREIRDAVNNSQATAWTRGEKREKGDIGITISGQKDTASRWPDIDDHARLSAIADSRAAGIVTVNDLRERSGDVAGDADDWIDALLPDAEWVCLAKGHPGSARSRLRDKWLFVAGDHDLIVPSPMTGPSGIALDGTRSHRCLGNTAPRRWQIVEFDSGALDEQASLHWHLKDAAPVFGLSLRCVVFSGSKSLHGWYGVTTDEKETRMFLEYAVIRGADYATANRAQLVRLPMGRRLIPSSKISLPDWGFDAGCDPRNERVRWDAFKWPVNFEEIQEVVYGSAN